MNLKITSEMSLSIGGSNVSNLYGTLVQHAYDNIETGGLTVPCDLKWWLNVIACESNKDQVWPINNINEKLASITVDITQEEAAAAGLPYTIYLKVADKLKLENPGTNVIVEI